MADLDLAEESVSEQKQNTEEINPECSAETDRTHGRRHSDLYSQKENEENGGDTICEEIMGGNFSKVKKGLGPQIQKLKKHT